MLKIQKTSYKHFFGTNIRHPHNILVKENFADLIGLCALVRTSDNKILLTHRKENLAEDANLWDLVSDNFMENNDNEPDANVELKKKLFKCLHLAALHIDDECCIGFSRDMENHKPTLLFYYKLNIAASSLENAINKSEDYDEIDESLCFVIMSFSENPVLQDFYEKSIKRTKLLT